MFQLQLEYFILTLYTYDESSQFYKTELTLSQLMSYIYMDLLVKPEILTLYIYRPRFGNAESRLFLFAAQCFSIESMQKVFLCYSCV
jgi:hypothetical protein